MTIRTMARLGARRHRSGPADRGGVTAQNDWLPRQVDELAALVQALEAAPNQRPRSAAPGSTAGAATK